MTDDELKALVASLAASQAETDRLMRESKAQVDKQLKELGKQIGGIGEKFGSFTEGMAFPSMAKILSERFKMEYVMPSVQIRKGGEAIEIDVLAYANSTVNEVYLVEVKSHAKEDAISQLQGLLSKFKTWFPEHKDKAVYGILSAVKIPKAVHDKAIKAGLYVANIHNDIFALDVPRDFQPARF